MTVGGCAGSREKGPGGSPCHNTRTAHGGIILQPTGQVDEVGDGGMWGAAREDRGLLAARGGATNTKEDLG